MAEKQADQAQPLRRQAIPPGLENSVLARLRLSSQELAALKEQGFVAADKQGENRYYKLRFRQGSKQCVRYLGSDPILAEQVRQELAILQDWRICRRVLKKLCRSAGRLLRSGKRDLEAALAEAGFAFHGLALRQKRNPIT
jgi:hypothetical protein